MTAGSMLINFFITFLLENTHCRNSERYDHCKHQNDNNNSCYNAPFFAIIKQTNQQIEEEFWERETKANSVRKKSLDHLPYITFDFDALPTADSFSESGAQVPESLEILQNLRDKKMLNLNGISNTDLKLKYGAPNITRLSEYEENFTIFSIHIVRLAQALYDIGRKSEAKTLLEKTIVTGTDISEHYLLLARLYLEEGKPGKINDLILLAEKLPTMMKDTILTRLKELL